MTAEIAALPLDDEATFLAGEIIACIERSVSNRPIDVTAFIAQVRRLREMTANHVLTNEELDAAVAKGRP